MEGPQLCTTARPYKHTPLTKNLYMHTIITVPSRPTHKLHTLTVHIHLAWLCHFLHHALNHLFDHFDHADWVAIRCETSEATTVVAEASEALCNEIVIVLYTCACMYRYLTAYLPANVCAFVIILRILPFVKVGETALFKAAYSGKTAIITELVEKGADPNIPNKVRFYKSCLYILLLISREKG